MTTTRSVQQARRAWIQEQTEDMLVIENNDLRAENRELRINLQAYRELAAGALECVARTTKRNHELALRIGQLTDQIREYIDPEQAAAA